MEQAQIQTKKRMISDDQKSQLFDLVKKLGIQIEIIKREKKQNYTLKPDKSPITKADLLVNDELTKFARQTEFRNIISEENSSDKYDVRKNWEFFWLIDPIDGTKEFIDKGDDFTINIALCQFNKPIFSIVYAPARFELYSAEKNLGAYLNGKRISVNKPHGNEINIVASKSHLNKETKSFIELIKKKYKINLLQFGSSLKICKIAEGVADLYPRFGQTMEWDTCAAQLILEEAGGRVQELESNDLSYNKPQLLNPYFIASSFNVGSNLN